MSTPPTYKPLEIEVTDFGPIARAKLDLRPLTVFVGPSNTGKSYLAMLIYALHRFFGGYTPSLGSFDRVEPSIFHRYVDIWGNENGLTEEGSSALLAWMNQLHDCTQGQPFPEDFRARVPEDVAALLRPLLTAIGTLGEHLNDEVARCFGSEVTGGLIRHGSSRGAQIVLKRCLSEAEAPAEPLAFTFAVQGSKTKLSASIPDAAPLQIWRDDGDSRDRHEIEQWISRTQQSREYQGYAEQYTRHAAQLADSQQSELAGRAAEDMRQMVRKQAQSRRNELASLVSTSFISPLHRVAYYLPADRAALMDTRSLIVSSLIRRSMRTGLKRGEALPALTGVLADFLEKLVVFEDYTQRDQKDGWNLARMLEIEILKGELRENRSETGHTTFTYRPAGRTEEVPILQASSMVSEVAPVILYLRQVIKPGDVLIIEEPEAHLHPAMQAAFTRQLAAVVRAGVRVMITTHSDYVLEELANLVRMSELPETEQASLQGAEFALREEDVGVWLFEPGEPPKGSVVKEVMLDKDAGLYSAGYSEVSEALYNMSVAIDNRIGKSRPD